MRVQERCMFCTRPGGPGRELMYPSGPWTLSRYVFLLSFQNDFSSHLAYDQGWQLTCLKWKKRRKGMCMKRGRGKGRGEEREWRGSKLLGYSILVRSVGSQHPKWHQLSNKSFFLLPWTSLSIEQEVNNSPGLSSSGTKQLHRSRFSRNLIQKLGSQSYTSEWHSETSYKIGLISEENLCPPRSW